MFLKTTYDDYQYSDYFKTDLPQHWTEKRLCYLAKEERAAFVDGPFGSDLKTSDYMDDGVPLIQLNNIRDSKHLMQNMKFVTEEKKNQLIRHLAIAGDVVIAKMAEPVARAAIVGSNYSEYVIVADCVKMTANLDLVDLRYLVWAINSDYVRINAELVSTGTTRIRVNLGELKKLKIPYPSYIEQQQIANFLDHETTKIDTLIEKQRRLIELLKEKRQAVISHAVTKGLNPSLPMKDSGVEWLGEVPEHWEVKKISYVAILKSGDGITSEQIEDTGTYPVYGGNGLRGYSENFNHDGDYILIGRQGALCGNINYGYGKFWASEHAVVVHPSLPLSFKWLGETLRSMDLNQYNVSAAQPGLAVANITCLKIPFPDIEEQNDIALFVENETVKIDTLIKKSNSAIELMQERRTALISAAVTGKIDVRQWESADTGIKTHEF